jgi:hypothetical protein
VRSKSSGFVNTAVRVGVLDASQVQRAQRLQRAERGTLEEVVREHFLTPGLAKRVAVAAARAEATCARCGRLRGRLAVSSGEHACRCARREEVAACLR